MPINDPSTPDDIQPAVEEAIRDEIDECLCFLSTEKAGMQKPGGPTRKEKELFFLSIAYAHMRAAPAQLHARAAVRASASMAEISLCSSNHCPLHAGL